MLWKVWTEQGFVESAQGRISSNMLGPINRKEGLISAIRQHSILYPANWKNEMRQLIVQILLHDGTCMTTSTVSPSLLNIEIKSVQCFEYKTHSYVSYWSRVLLATYWLISLDTLWFEWFGYVEN
jgi:hypothetical protein